MRLTLTEENKKKVIGMLTKARQLLNSAEDILNADLPEDAEVDLENPISDVCSGIGFIEDALDGVSDNRFVKIV